MTLGKERELVEKSLGPPNLLLSAARGIPLGAGLGPTGQLVLGDMLFLSELGREP